MADFQELIKDFERIRDYIRQFFIYGYKVREQYDTKSARTYDNERRRCESWLNQFVRTDYNSLGKQFSIQVDSKNITENPLYAAWKSKSFTDNDILLHFFLLDILSENGAQTANALSDLILDRYHSLIDPQTIRNKLKEYESLGILQSEKNGKQLFYHLTPPLFSETSPLFQKLMTAVSFYQESAPFGFVGSTLLDHELMHNEFFRFKHHFIVHTLEDGVCYEILEAIQTKSSISYSNKSPRSGTITTHQGIPFQIFVSTATGRRYVCMMDVKSSRLVTRRLDALSAITVEQPVADYDKQKAAMESLLPHCFGVSLNGAPRLEEIFFILQIDIRREPYVLERLYRERRGGEITELGNQLWQYHGTFFDTQEMAGWIKSFTGRITKIWGTNKAVIQRITRDFDEMYEMYGKESSHGTV